MADPVLRIDAPLRFRALKPLNEGFIVVVGTLAAVSTVTSLVTLLIYGFLDEYSVDLDLAVWLFISVLVLAPIIEWAFCANKHAFSYHSNQGEATNDYRRLNKDHQALCKDALIGLYNIDGSTHATVAAGRERKDLIKQVLAKQESDAYNAITIDNSDIIALREYVGMKGINT